MNFTSSTFLFGFLPIFLLIYFLMPNNLLKNIVILIGSLFFYSSGEPIFVYLMVLSIIFNFFIGKFIYKNRIDDKKSKLIFISGIVLNLLVLFFFKYLDFIINTINALFYIKIKNLNISLPIGISFFIFQEITYISDVYLNRNNFVKGQREYSFYTDSILKFAVYVSMFPQLVAGPIVRFNEISKDIVKRRFNLDNLNLGMKRFIYGLSKKVLIANNMAIVADTAFSIDPVDAGYNMLFLGAVSYAFQIYFDFSGYSDMAIGIGKILGFSIPENFNNPYMAVSVQDFFRRWHMTLYRFFRDYVYFPLGGSKGSFNKTMINLFVVFILTGLWHGAKWNFVFWGFFYFLFLAMEKFIFVKTGSTIDKKLPYLLSRIYTLLVIITLWVFFRSGSVRNAFLYLVNMYNLSNPGLVNYEAVFYIKEFLPFYLIAILYSLGFFERFDKLFLEDKKNTNWYFVLNTIYLVLLMFICTFYLIKGSYNPFIYFNF